MERLFWFARPENFRNKWNVFIGSPKFPTGISEGKCAFHLLFLLVPDLLVCIRRGEDVRANRTRTPHGNFHSGF